MIKVKKISIENFKGMKSNVIFDFNPDNKSVNVLAGPNGFGKTTIFEVIELCITGEFKRVENFSSVQKKNSHKNKPFFQNTDNEDVILKLWICNTDNNSEHIIIKHYDDIHSPKQGKYAKNFIPDDASSHFSTYLTSETSYFLSNDFSGLELTYQETINKLFYGEGSKINLTSTYYLFNYIQQEDSIYFLRKTEDAKGTALAFLFNIEKEQAELDKLGTLRDNFRVQLSSLEQNITNVKNSLPSSSTLVYTKLFQNSDFVFDREQPFTNQREAIDQLSEYENIVNDLILFRTTFEIGEYNKYQKFKKLNDEIINNEELLINLLIKNIYSGELVNLLEVKNQNISKATSFLKTSNIATIDKSFFDLVFSNEDEYNSYLIIETAINNINNDLGAIGKIISELNVYREKILEEFEKLRLNQKISESNCPLCNTEFTSYDQLIASVNSQTKSLQLFNEQKLSEKNLQTEKIKEFHLKISSLASKYIESNNYTDPLIISYIRGYSNVKEQVENIYAEYSVLDSSSMDTIKLLVCPSSLDALNERKSQLKSFLIDTLLPEFKYDSEKVMNPHLYKNYFNDESELFNLTSVDALQNKLIYIKGRCSVIASERLNYLISRSDKLTKILSNIAEIHRKTLATIQQHKKEMIEKIMIPFYVYSGKILQSYQQGLGIFVDIHDTPQSNNVKFKTSHLSDHDIVYHLSSGQMAVVSLAFCLSLNKVYNTSDHFKFLAIDDPIQTMDDLNIHTFIELIRNEFANYQLIFSTHDDFTSRYMKYKFDKFNMGTDILSIQKIVMEQSTN